MDRPRPQVPGVQLVGFYLHETKKSGCGDVAFWCSVHPSVGRLADDEDVVMNGGQASMFSTREWVCCRRCGRWMHLNLRYYRAIPRPSDLRSKPWDEAERPRAIATRHLPDMDTTPTNEEETK